MGRSGYMKRQYQRKIEIAFQSDLLEKNMKKRKNSESKEVKFTIKNQRKMIGRLVSPLKCQKFF